MAYKTNPIANRLGVTKGWANTKFINNKLTQQAFNEHWFKIFCLVQKRLEFYNWRVSYLDLLIFKNKKSLLIQGTKIRYKKIFKNKKLWKRRIKIDDSTFIQTKALVIKQNRYFLKRIRRIVSYSFMSNLKKEKNKKNKKIIAAFNIFFYRIKNWVLQTKDKSLYLPWRRWFLGLQLYLWTNAKRKIKEKRGKFFFNNFIAKIYKKYTNFKKSTQVLYSFKYSRKLLRAKTNLIWRKKTFLKTNGKKIQFLLLKKKKRFRIKNFIKIRNPVFSSYLNFRMQKVFMYKEQKKLAAAREKLARQGKNKEFKFLRTNLKITKLNFLIAQWLKKLFNTNYIVKFCRNTRNKFLKNYLLRLSLKRPRLRRYRRDPMFLRMLPLMFLFSKYKNPEPLTLQFAIEFERRKKHWPIIRSYREFFRQIAPRTLYGWRVVIKGKVNGVPRARTYTITQGPIPLQHFSKRINYVFLPADAKTGSFSIKTHCYY